MKLFFMSDIHGSAVWLNRALAKVEEEKADYIVILGDLLYHGPRNPLPDEYNPKAVAERLNAYKERIIAVRGNCDAEVDQMLIEFPILSDCAILFHEGRRIYATHGHHFHIDQLPQLSGNDIFIQGHTHVPVAEKRGDVFVLNPGSISLPKENNPQSYGVLEGLDFRIKDFAGNTLKQISM